MTAPAIVMQNNSAIPTRIVRFGSVKVGQFIKIVREGHTSFERITHSRNMPSSGQRTVTTVVGTPITAHVDSDVEII